MEYLRAQSWDLFYFFVTFRFYLKLYHETMVIICLYADDSNLKVSGRASGSEIDLLANTNLKGLIHFLIIINFF